MKQVRRVLDPQPGLFQSCLTLVLVLGGCVAVAALLSALFISILDWAL